MLRKRDFLNTSAERVKRGAFSVTYRAVRVRIDFGRTMSTSPAKRSPLLAVRLQQSSALNVKASSEKE